MLQVPLVLVKGGPRKLFKTAVMTARLLPHQTTLFDRISISLHLLTRPIRFLAGLGEGDILERSKPHLSLPPPELKAKDPLCASVSALMKPQTLPIAVFPGREGLEFCNRECVRFCHDNILFVIYVLA